MKALLLLALCIGCSDGGDHQPEPKCDPGAVLVHVSVPLTPYVREQFQDCTATDDPASYGRVWCCPVSP